MVLPLQIQYMKQSKSDKLQRHHYIDFSLSDHGETVVGMVLVLVQRILLVLKILPK